MDLCKGGSLASLLKDCVCLSLFCHKQACILNCDIKPANILFSEQGRLDFACLTDFGISVHLDGTAGIFYGPPGEGSRVFMALETEEYGYYSAVSDIWGLVQSSFFACLLG